MTIGAAVLAALAGYLARGVEFRRAERLAAYGDVSAAFVAAANSGSNLLSLSMAYGSEASEQPSSREMWERWSADVQAFRESAGRMRIIASSKAREELVVLEEFVQHNILEGEPFAVLNAKSPTENWGEHLSKGPAAVYKAAVEASRTFGDAVRRDFRIYRR